jgi:MtrB/PioB family decaheme-associated outer membrane protein
MKRIALAVAAALAPALPAFATGHDDPTRIPGVVEIGVAYLDEDSRKFGEYTGIREQGTYVIGNIDILRRRPDDPNYWLFTGTNLGLDSRNITAEVGRQGRFQIWGEYDQLPKYGPTAQTIYRGVGSGNLTLPAGFQGLTTADTANTPAGFALRSNKINPFLQEVNLEQERKNYKFGGGINFTPELSANVAFRREDKEGLKLFGGVFGNSGGNPRSSLLPEPVDYSTTHVEATVAYTTRPLQLRAGYYISKFENDQKGLTWQNPYAPIGGWAAAAGFPTGIGLVALAPDNDYSRLRVDGGYNFAGHTRLSFVLQRGRMEQNDQFFDYTVNPALAITTPLPRSSADARIDTTLATLNLTARPIRKLHLHATVRYEEMDNKTPQATYVYIGGDSTVQAPFGTTNRTRTNLPLSTERFIAKIGGTYEVMPRTKLKFAYDYDVDERRPSETIENKTHLVMLGLRRSMTDDLNGEISWTRAKRTAEDYDYNAIYHATFAPAFIAPQIPTNTDWDNLPIMSRFVYADRERDKLRLQLNASPSPFVSAQLFADYLVDDYDDTIMGLLKARTASVTGELSFTPNERLSGNVFYTRDRAKYNQAGRTFSSATMATLGFAPTSPNDWFNEGEDRGDTAGLGIKFQAIPKRATVGVDLMHSKMVGKIDTTTGPGIAVAGIPLPDLRTKLQRAQIYGTYQVNPNLGVKLSYWYQKLETNDWQWEGYVPATLPNVITAGLSSPDYKVNFFGVSLIYRFF